MKVRNGFVSNSSSSSFVLGKYFMTPEQIEEFKSLIKEIDDVKENGFDSPICVTYEGEVVGYDEDTYIGEDENYFFGDVGQHTDTVIFKFLEKHPNLEGKYVFEG
jgi:hypothetical protein